MSQLDTVESSPLFEKNEEHLYQGQYAYENGTFPLGTTGADYIGQDDGQLQGANSSYSSFYPYTMPVYNMFSNVNTTFSTKFPRAKDYFNQESILESFPHLEGLNELGFDVESIPDHAHFYIMRSSNDDNIHKAIKYHMWSTTNGGKNALSNAWKDAEKQGVAPEIYLIFSVVNSNHVLGVAKMTSDVKDDETFMYWWEPIKWFGSFQLKWLFIKDIHCSKFEHIKEENSGTSSFINLKDSTKLSADSGKEVLKIFRDFIATSNIFGSFAYMDSREDYIRLQRDNNSYFLSYFEECCAAYQRNPDNFSPVKKSQYNNRRNGGSYQPNRSVRSFNTRRQGNTYYRKTYATKQQSSGNTYVSSTQHNTVSTKSDIYRATNKTQPSLSADEYPPLSLAEQFGIKNQKKALKLSKKEGKEGSDKSDNSDKSEKTNDENVPINN